MIEHQLEEFLRNLRVVALVGASMKPDRASYMVGNALAARGIRVIPVNPGHAGEVLFGETVVARLADIPPEAGVELVDIFRRSEDVGQVVEEALLALPQLKLVWMQVGISNLKAAALARAQGIVVVEDRCLMVDHARALG